MSVSPEWQKGKGALKAYKRIVRDVKFKVKDYCSILEDAGICVGDPSKNQVVLKYLEEQVLDTIVEGTVGDVLDVYEHYMYDIKRVEGTSLRERVTNWFIKEIRMSMAGDYHGKHSVH